METTNNMALSTTETVKKEGEQREEEEKGEEGDTDGNTVNET